MKNNLILALLSFSIFNGTYGSAHANSGSAPQLEWIKNEVSTIWQTKAFRSNEKLDELLAVDVKNLTLSSIVIAEGHFTNKDHQQFLLTVPANSLKGNTLGWETNLWLLIEKDEENHFKTVSTMRGDVAYQNSLIDVDNDGLQEVSMINRLSCNNGSQQITYKLYSFQTQKFLYSSIAVDNWNCDKEKNRKSFKKGDIMYSVLQLKHEDVDNDGSLEIVETWIQFKYNGGKRISEIEQKKSMAVQTRILKLHDGVYN